MKFTKMQGCGNDYIYVNGFSEKIPLQEKPDLVRRISERHFGIGSDGAIFINPCLEADFEMEMYNADGSRSEMCGNGIRCVGKYVYDFGLTNKTKISVMSGGKIKYLDLILKDNKVSRVKVNMGTPEIWEQELLIQGNRYHPVCVSMGNPHAVIFLEELERIGVKSLKELNIESMGPHFENHPAFLNRTNTEFVQVLNDGEVSMRVWERGSGETLACGTGCCATAVACIVKGYTGEVVLVHVLGGELLIEWNRTENIVYMTGPAETVFEGEIM